MPHGTSSQGALPIFLPFIDSTQAVLPSLLILHPPAHSHTVSPLGRLCPLGHHLIPSAISGNLPPSSAPVLLLHITGV